MFSSATLPSPPRPPVALGVLGLHLALLVLALQADLLQQVIPRVLPVQVALLSTVAPPPAAPTLPAETALPTPPRAAAPALQLLPPPQLELRDASTQPMAVQAPRTALVADSAPAPQAPLTAPAPAVPAPVAPAPPTEPRQVPSGAISYRVPPAIAVPLASRRLRESGTVWLRVRVDRMGLPVQVSVHKSSGYPRLDEQALAAMQAARFVPQTENGLPVEWVVIAPLAYDID